MDTALLYVTVLTRSSLSPEAYECLLAGASDECRARALRFAARADAENTVLAEALAKAMLLRHAAIDTGRRPFSRDKYAKPHLPQRPDIHFNLSHSGGFVACAVAARPVGIDIQKTTGITHPLDIAKRFFAPAEYAHITQGGLSGADGQAARFARVWAMKESYVKREGKGLHIPLDSFDVLAPARQALFREIPVGGDAACFVCYDLPGVTNILVCPAESFFAIR